MTTDERYPVEGKPGWFLDGWGYEFHDPDPAEPLDLARARLFLLTLDEAPTPPAPPPPGVYAVEVGGRWPRPENVAAIRRAVDAIPYRYRGPWLAKGGRLEIIAGSNARIHPKGSAHLGPALGWYHLGGTLCVVAGDHPDAAQTSLHEVGHAIDYALGGVSRRPQWVEIWKRDRGKVPAIAGQREKPGEYWAESFAILWNPAAVYLHSREAERYIEGIV